MKPYNRRFIRDDRNRIFNYRLSRARKSIECSFGILCSKWKVFGAALCFDMENSDYIVSACMCLHNYIITRNIQNVEAMEIPEAENVINGRRKLPNEIRHIFTEYFSSPQGSVPWQDKYV